MPDKRPLTWILAALLLFNAVGVVLILVELNDTDEKVAISAIVVPPAENETLDIIQIEPEIIRENSPQSDMETEQAVTESPIQHDSYPNIKPTETVIARVNGADIGQSLLDSYLNQLASAEQRAQWDTLDDVPQKLVMQGINDAALDNLLVQLALQIQLDQDPTTAANIEHSKRNILKNAFLERLAPGLVNDEAIINQYASLSASLKGKQEYRAKHILLANEKEARIVDKAIEEKNKTFDELAKLFSLDDATSYRGGDLGYVLDGQLNAEFETAIGPLKIGQISKPFETELGWHIAVVDDRRKARPMTLEQATPIIRRKLEQQAIQQYLADLLDSADIEVLLSFEPGE